MSRYEKLNELEKDCLMLSEKAEGLGLEQISIDLSNIYHRIGDVLYQIVLGGEE